MTAACIRVVDEVDPGSTKHPEPSANTIAQFGLFLDSLVPFALHSLNRKGNALKTWSAGPKTVAA